MEYLLYNTLYIFEYAYISIRECQQANMDEIHLTTSLTGYNDKSMTILIRLIICILFCSILTISNAYMNSVRPHNKPKNENIAVFSLFCAISEKRQAGNIASDNNSGYINKYKYMYCYFKAVNAALIQPILGWHGEEGH